MLCGLLVPGDTMWEKVPWSNELGKHCVLTPLLDIPLARYTKALRSPAGKKLIYLPLIWLPSDVSESKQLPLVILVNISSLELAFSRKHIGGSCSTPPLFLQGTL